MLTVGDVLPELVYDSLDQYTDSLKIFDFLGMSKYHYYLICMNVLFI